MVRAFDTYVTAFAFSQSGRASADRNAVPRTRRRFERMEPTNVSCVTMYL